MAMRPSFLAQALAQASGTTNVAFVNNGIADIGVSAFVPGAGSFFMVNRILPNGDMFILNHNIPLHDRVTG